MSENKTSPYTNIGGLRASYSVQVAFSLFGLCLLCGQPTWASTNVCDLAARDAARQFGIPVSVMQALTRVETGRKKGGRWVPWPWTTNVEGDGRWFKTQSEALSFLKQQVASGVKSFDVGCFQINHRWHGHAFRSIEEMFDPDKNAAYAASFVLGLYQEKGNWEDAAAAYHSRTPKLAKKYKAKFQKIHAGVTAITGAGQESEEKQTGPRRPAKKNQYPLLLKETGRRYSPGSLVPMLISNRPPFLRSGGRG